MSAFCWVSTMEEMESNIVHDLTAMGYEEDEITHALHETKLRLKWKVDSLCLIYSRSSRTWCDGFIVKIFNDEMTNQEWLMVQYRKNKKRIQRFSDCLKPTSFDESYRQQRILVLHITQRLKAALQDTSLMVTNPLSSAINMYIEQTPQRPKAPVLWIYDIAESTATVKVSSGFNALSIIYRVRYRKFGEHESEEIMEWTERRSTAKISGLSSNTKYVIDADYCAMGSNVWSEVSSQTFTTFDLMRKRALLVLSFWMRTILNVSSDMLSDLVLRYFLIEEFAWDPNRMHHSFRLSNDDRRITKVEEDGNQQHSVCSTMSYSTSFRWQLSLKNIRSWGTCWFMMGYTSSVNDFNPENPIGRHPNDVCLAVMGQSYPVSIYTNSALTELDGGSTYAGKINDRFRLDFDFTNKTVAAFVNDQPLGLLTTNLPERVFLVVSVNKQGTALETTVFEWF